MRSFLDVWKVCQDTTFFGKNRCLGFCEDYVSCPDNLNIVSALVYVPLAGRYSSTCFDAGIRMTTMSKMQQKIADATKIV